MRDFGKKTNNGLGSLPVPTGYSAPEEIGGVPELFYVSDVVRRGLHVSDPSRKEFYPLAKLGDMVFLSAIMRGRTTAYRGITTKLNMGLTLDHNWLGPPDVDKGSGNIVMSKQHEGTYLVLAQATFLGRTGSLTINRNNEFMAIANRDGGFENHSLNVHTVMELYAGDTVQMYFQTRDAKAEVSNDFHNTRLDLVKLR
jgi:hypothetical protein